MENDMNTFSTNDFGLDNFLHYFGVLYKSVFYIFANLDHVISVLLVLCFLVTYFVACYFHKHSRGYLSSKLDRNRTRKTCFDVNLRIKYKRWKK